MSGPPNAISIELSAAIVAVEGERPSVLVVSHNGAEDSLPFGPFDPVHHRTLELGLRKWVGEQTRFELGYTEQLYTFGDLGRHRTQSGRDPATRVVSVGYLALTRQVREAPSTLWRGWYHYFPWEDWRDAKPATIDETILPALRKFTREAPSPEIAEQRRERINICFGEGWDEERVLERYELLYEAGLVEEFHRGASSDGAVCLGTAMQFDHRRILATAIARLRGKLKYRPVVFDLLPPQFTLLQLQRLVEALSGVRLHKQNFRRLVVSDGLVEPTGRLESRTGGRPAELHRFRRDVLRERAAAGVGLPTIRITE